MILGTIGAVNNTNNQFYKSKQKWVNWIGPCDKETCEGCRKAFTGNPYPIDKAPQPGSFECGENCRHALQLTRAPRSIKKVK